MAEVFEIDADSYVKRAGTHPGSIESARIVLVSAADYRTVKRERNARYPSGAFRWKYTGGSQSGVTGTLIAQTDERLAGRWKRPNGTAPDLIKLALVVGGPTRTVILELQEIVADGPRLVTFAGVGLIRMDFVDSEATLEILAGEVRSYTLGESPEFNMANELRIDVAAAGTIGK